MSSETDRGKGNMDYFAAKSLEKLKTRLEVREKVEMADIGDVVRPRLFELLKSEDHQERVKGARLFMETGTQSDLPRLVDFLTSEEHEYVIATLVKAIGALADDESYMDVLIKYLKHENSRVRANTIEALGFFETERVFREIAPFITERNNRVKANVAKILWRYSMEKTLRYLKDMLDSEDLWTCYSAVFALAEIGHYKTRALLMYALLNTNTAIRLRAAKALHEMDQALSDDVSQLVLSLDDRKKYAIPTRVINYQVRLLASQAPRERGAGARILFHIAEPGDRNVLQALKDLISRETDESVLGPALMAYLRVGRHDALEDISEYLSCPNPRIRADVIEGLATFDDPAVLDLAVPSLSDPASRVRANAARVMWRFSEKRTMEYILEMLRSKDHPRMKSAIFILGEIGSEETREVLLKLLAETTGELNESVGEALIRVNRKLWRRSRFRGEQKGRTGVPITEDPSKFINKNVNLLVDTDFTVRRRAVELLTSSIGDETFEVFRERLVSEENPFIKATLVKIVSKQGGDESVSLLRDFLRDPDSRVRSNCVEALGEIQSSSVIGLITPMLSDPSSRVRESAAIVIWKISENRDFDRLKQMVDDLRGALKTTARETLELHENLKKADAAKSADDELLSHQDAMDSEPVVDAEKEPSWEASQAAPASIENSDLPDSDDSETERNAPGPKSSAYDDIMTDMNTKMDHLVGPDAERGITGKVVVDDEIFSGGVTPKVRKLYRQMGSDSPKEQPSVQPRASVSSNSVKKSNLIPWTVAVFVMVINLFGTYFIITRMGSRGADVSVDTSSSSVSGKKAVSGMGGSKAGTSESGTSETGTSETGGAPSVSAVERNNGKGSSQVISTNSSDSATGDTANSGDASKDVTEPSEFTEAADSDAARATDSSADRVDTAALKKLIDEGFRTYEKHFDAGDFRNARLSLEKLLTLDRRNVRAHYLLGATYVQEGRLSEAESEFNRALEVEPRNTDVLFGLANVLVSLSREDRAIEHLQELLKINEKDTPSLIMMGKIRLSQGQAAVAREKFSQAYDILASLDTLELRASASMSMGRWQEALADYKLLASKASGSPAGNIGMARVYMVLKWLTQALECSAKAMEIDPASLEAQVVHAMVLSAMGRSDEARQFAEKALASGLDSSEPYAVLGEVAMGQMKFSDAIGFYQEALARDSRNPDYFYMIGRCHEEGRDFESALSSFSSALILLDGTGRELEGAVRTKITELEASTSAGARPVVAPASSASGGSTSTTAPTTSPSSTGGRGNRDKYGRGR
ncbi:MAG: hypothetical protein CVV64_10515 [Candidatus Wallbacteria bacterium HGW-Wallbacteria-1]|uniref:Uncharacterized protein n=1 Tax=Candidatus Wallbacteria bacterium HGW-Wallbacteria-1 TaxID=2013854 RepID=A0A2N1PP89_9BACT|nr:MAG: hypothetical protein CVV64_10515 [Candidatus Wallbacteria bacterium HGW-Wallbacteria-1]